MSYIYPNYSNSLLNLMASIRSFYHLPISYKTLQLADDILKNKKYKKVVLILLDGMGSRIIPKHLDENSFIRTNLVGEILSTFPSTTVAATTSVRTCKSPIENGYLGWHQYFKDLDSDINIFNGHEYYGDKQFNPIPAKVMMPFKTLCEELKENGHHASEIFPFPSEHTAWASRFNAFLKMGVKLNKTNDYLYMYWGNPDMALHDYGVESKKVTKLLKRYDKKLEKFASKLPSDTCCFVIADHGHIDVEPINLFKYKDVDECLIRKPSIEPRNATLFIKEDKKEKFVELFNKYFKDDFLLFTKDEVIEKKLFGEGEPNPKSFDFIGDFQMVAITNKVIYYSEDDSKEFGMKATHAGMNEDEMFVPLINIK